VVGQSLQLNGSGGNIYAWSPTTWLSNPNSRTPVIAPESDIEYKVLVTANPPGCSGTASVKIKVFLLPPSLYVPTVFSPNGDGTNDILVPQALGLRKMKFFRIYNRWGQLVFETSELNKGWDGTYKNTPQDPGTFVWAAEAETYKGEVIKQKKYVVLVR
jgi:gliding motility-associated-like protein